MNIHGLADERKLRQRKLRRHETAEAENALIGSLLRKPFEAKRLPLIPTDFLQFGAGRTFAIINDADENEYDRRLFPQIFTALCDDVGNDDAAETILGHWIVDFCQHQVWWYWAKLVAKDSLRRTVKKFYLDGLQDLDDQCHHDVIESDFQTVIETRNRLEALL